MKLLETRIAHDVLGSEADVYILTEGCVDDTAAYELRLTTVGEYSVNQLAQFAMTAGVKMTQRSAEKIFGKQENYRR